VPSRRGKEAYGVGPRGRSPLPRRLASIICVGADGPVFQALSQPRCALGQAGPLRLFQLLAKHRWGASLALGGWTSRLRLRRWRRAPPGSGKRLAGPYHQQLRLRSMMEQPRLAPRTLPLLLQMVGCSSSTTGFSPRCPRLCSPCRHLLHRAQHRLLLAAKPWQG
jgi:hypothetical protein